MRSLQKDKGSKKSDLVWRIYYSSKEAKLAQFAITEKKGRSAVFSIDKDVKSWTETMENILTLRLADGEIPFKRKYLIFKVPADLMSVTGPHSQRCKSVAASFKKETKKKAQSSPRRFFSQFPQGHSTGIIFPKRGLIALKQGFKTTFRF